MTLSSLSIRDCRNLEAVDIQLAAGLNLFVGPNGAGKTALLEAVHVLSRGRSFRSSQATRVIRRDQPEMIVRAGISRDSGPSAQLSVARPRRGATRVHLDGDPMPGGVSAASKLLPVQVMLPGVSDLVFAGPADRRRWLDWGVFHVEPLYLRTWRGYHQLLKQRNARLKQLPPGTSSDSVLETFTDQLVAAAEPLALLRRSYVASWLPYFAETLRKLDLTLSALAPELNEYGASDRDELADLMSQNRSRDVKLGVTHSGPHRFDLVLKLFDRPVGESLSRGQGKTVALAMMQSQAEFLAAKTGQNSLFLIDDAGAELDRDHNASFFEALADTNAQIMATCTEEPWTGAAYPGLERALFHVEQGQITRE
ncbi:MAG: DNA replication/repair protein RecF [Pseudomonadales bacterium]